MPAILPPGPVTPPAKKKVGRKAIASQPIEELTPGAAKRQKARESMKASRARRAAAAMAAAAPPPAAATATVQAAATATAPAAAPAAAKRRRLR